MLKREFTVADEYHFQRSSPVRWIISHLKRYTHLIIAYVLACILANILYTAIPIMTGLAFDGVLQHDQSKLLLISLVLLALVVLGGTSDLSARFFPELLGKRFARRCWPGPVTLVSAEGVEKPDLPQPAACGRHHGASRQ